jgi:hypothetical protein
VENKVFQEKRKFLDYISENGAVYQNSEDFFRSWISSLRAEEKLLKIVKGHQTCHARSIIF